MMSSTSTPTTPTLIPAARTTNAPTAAILPPAAQTTASLTSPTLTTAAPTTAAPTIAALTTAPTTAVFTTVATSPATSPTTTPEKITLDLIAKIQVAEEMKETVSAAIKEAEETKKAVEDLANDLESLDFSVFVASRKKREVANLPYPRPTNCEEVMGAMEEIRRLLDPTLFDIMRLLRAKSIIALLKSMKLSELDPSCTNDERAEFDSNKAAAKSEAAKVVEKQTEIILTKNKELVAIAKEIEQLKEAKTVQVNIQTFKRPL